MESLTFEQVMSQYIAEFDAQICCDCTIIAKDGSFQAHQIILESSSSELKKLFEMSPGHHMVDFQGSSMNVLRKVVELIYKRKVHVLPSEKCEFHQTVENLKIQYHCVPTSIASEVMPLTSSAVYNESKNKVADSTECSDLKTSFSKSMTPVHAELDQVDENQPERPQKAASKKKPKILCPGQDCDQRFKNEISFQAHFERVHVKNTLNRRRCSVAFKVSHSHDQ